MTGDSGGGDMAAGSAAEVPIIETRDVSRHFSAGRAATGRSRATLKAVDGVSLAIRRGETLALVGETGSGKTTFGRLLLGLYRPTSGDILYQGQSILDRKGQAARAVRRQIQGVFQDPYSSLNPTMTVGQSLAEVLKVHRVVGRQDRAQKVAELLETVGLSPAQASRRPLAFSGGERQRVGIARALAVSPDIVIADEPLSALDVSIQAQVLNLMIKLQDERGLTYLFVTHDLDVARHINGRPLPGQGGRVRAHDQHFRPAAAPLYPGACARGAPAHHGAQDSQAGPHRRHPERDRPAAGLPLPPALPARHAGLQGAGTATAPAVADSVRRLPPA